MRITVTFLFTCLLLAACGRDSGPDSTGAADGDGTSAATVAASKAVPTIGLDLATCLADESADAEAELSSCPTYVQLSLDLMIDDCSRAGGALQPLAQSAAWLLDVDADSQAEVLVDLTQNFICHGQPSVFSCGSLGCPYFLYAQRGDGWAELGAVNADDAPALEVLTGPAGTPATLRGGCLGERPCSELTHYDWKGSAYERSWILYRGHIVDVAAGGLQTLTRDAPVLTAPSSDGQVIDEYPVGTAMVVIGSARKGPYRFVSPCNACRRGFVEAALLKK